MFLAMIRLPQSDAFHGWPFGSGADRWSEDQSEPQTVYMLKTLP